MNREINKDRIETLYESRFLNMFDLQYTEGRHYYEATRRSKDSLVLKKNDAEFRSMLPDAVTIAVKEAADVDLIDNRVFPPRLAHARSHR